MSYLDYLVMKCGNVSRSLGTIIYDTLGYHIRAYMLKSRWKLSITLRHNADKIWQAFWKKISSFSSLQTFLWCARHCRSNSKFARLETASCTRFDRFVGAFVPCFTYRQLRKAYMESWIWKHSDEHFVWISYLSRLELLLRQVYRKSNCFLPQRKLRRIFLR